MKVCLSVITDEHSCVSCNEYYFPSILVLGFGKGEVDLVMLG
jgi:hypothetical protein